MEVKLMTYDCEMELLFCWMSVVKEVEAVNIIRECVPTQLKHTLREGSTLANCFGNLFIL
ncbi:hypothetical protein H5410_015800 [Solanum commersonii]|uniref:Uncharacterized protein n=1 Tax=Solanum commersonii TaxID=4109 RepID=A0A9J5ZUU7_SOLCO|nr:hypothetical protein H5410_015800 [Solanum commersonii]